MANYFEVTVAFTLRLDTPPQVLDTLAYMIRTEDYDFDNPLQHPFFDMVMLREPDWRSIFTGPYVQVNDVLPGAFSAILCPATPEPVSGAERSAFSCRVFNIDYMFDTYMAFLNWLAPYSETERFIGYSKWSDGEGPQLLYFIDGVLQGSELEVEPRELRTPARYTW